MPKPNKRRPIYRVTDGEPIAISLVKWKNSEFLEGGEQSVCCRCNLEHLFHYQVRRTSGKFWLVIRAFRLD